MIKDCRLTARVNESVFENFATEALRQDVTMAELMRKMVDDFLKAKGYKCLH